MSLHPYLTHEHPIRFAHRGSRYLWPENTIEAFQGAVDLGYRYLETDAHVTADGVVVAFHDHKLEQLTNGAGKVSDWRWEDLRLLDAGYRFKPEDGFPRRGDGVGIPRFDELLRTFPDALFNVDLKERNVADALAGLVRSEGAEERVLAASFHDFHIARYRAASPGRVATSAGPREVGRAWLSSRRGKPVATTADAIQVPERFGAFGVVDARFVTSAHEGGKHVHVWTVNDTPAMHRLLDLGVDGIVTDRPDLLNDVVVARRQP
jgi:glycerophosphoryl diester phosphodiesterase